MSTEAHVRTPTQPRAVRTRAAMLAAAAAEFSKAGYAATTARSITEHAGVATGSFYQYFADKDAALRELAENRFASVAARAVAALETADVTPGKPAVAEAREKLGEVVRAVTDFHRDDPGLHAVLTERRHADPELEKMSARAERMLVERVASLLARWGHAGDVEALAFVLFGMVEGAVHAHVLGRPVVSDARFFATIVDALVALALPPGAAAPGTDSPASKPRRMHR